MVSGHPLPLSLQSAELRPHSQAWRLGASYSVCLPEGPEKQFSSVCEACLEPIFLAWPQRPPPPLPLTQGPRGGACHAKRLPGWGQLYTVALVSQAPLRVTPRQPGNRQSDVRGPLLCSCHRNGKDQSRRGPTSVAAKARKRHKQTG